MLKYKQQVIPNTQNVKRTFLNTGIIGASYIDKMQLMQLKSCSCVTIKLVLYRLEHSPLLSLWKALLHVKDSL